MSNKTKNDFFCPLKVGSNLKCLLLVRKLFRENSALLASQTNSTHKHSQLGSHITEPISTWKVYFSWPPGEIYGRNLQWNLVFHIALKAESNFLLLVFFLEAVGAKSGRQQRNNCTTRKQTKAARWVKKVSKRKHGSFEWIDKL